MNIYWENAADDDLIYSETEKLIGDGARKAQEVGVWNEYLYLNYADKWQKPIKGYDEESADIEGSEQEV